MRAAQIRDMAIKANMIQRVHWRSVGTSMTVVDEFRLAKEKETRERERRLQQPGPLPQVTASAQKSRTATTTHNLLQWLDSREDSGFRGYFVSGRKSQDLEALVNHYTAPALARALRDREEILAECAALLSSHSKDVQTSKENIDPENLRKLREILMPYEVLPSSRKFGQHGKELEVDEVLTNESEYILPDFREGGLFHPDVLKRLRKRLHRLPREISSRAKKRASVILPLCHVNKEPCVLFTERSHNVNRHKGEVCFPGGMVDPDDPSVVDAGLRELHEEVGIHPDVVDVLGVLRCDWSEVASITGVAVTPIVGYLGAFEELQLDPNPGEVRAYFTVPVTSLLDKNNWVVREYSPPIFKEENAPNERVIWGLTGYILHRFMRLLPSVVFGKQIAQTDFARELSF